MHLINYIFKKTNTIKAINKKTKTIDNKTFNTFHISSTTLHTYIIIYDVHKVGHCNKKAEKFSFFKLYKLILAYLPQGGVTSSLVNIQITSKSSV